MLKTELISKVAEKSGLTKIQADAAMNAMIETITEALAEGDKISLKGFGSFEVRERKARTGLNPKTRETIEIPASLTPAFKASSVLKEAVKGK